MCCMICLDWAKGKMTSKEAMSAIGEMIANADNTDTAHLIKLAERIVDKDVSPGTTQNEAFDEEWERNNRGS